jgi:AraC-like DNA-binding protein
MADLVSEHVVGVPHPRLRPYVSDYTGYRMQGFTAGVHAGLPSRSLTLVISLDEPVDLCVMPDPDQRPQSFLAAVGGLHAAPAGIRHDGNQFGVQLAVTPLGARALFRRPASDLAHVVVELADLIGPAARSLPDRLVDAPDWAGRFAVLDSVLSGWLSDGRDAEPADEVIHAWSVMAARHGAVEVGSLANDVGWSRRHLSSRFREEYGLSPKVAARVMRFERAKGLLVAGPVPSLADVAARAGYADQAHLTREWKDMAGSTPHAWLRGEEFPFVQDRVVLTARS